MEPGSTGYIIAACRTNTDTTTKANGAGCRSSTYIQIYLQLHNLSFFLRPRLSGVPSDLRFWALGEGKGKNDEGLGQAGKQPSNLTTNWN